jgi:predicted lactoylglutathione lyase
MGNLRFRHAIPTLRIASIEKSLPFYKALGFEISWQHQLNPDAPRLTSVTHESVELFLTEHWPPRAAAETQSVRSTVGRLLCCFSTGSPSSRSNGVENSVRM